jgi:hypothetical protein
MNVIKIKMPEFISRRIVYKVLCRTFCISLIIFLCFPNLFAQEPVNTVRNISKWVLFEAEGKLKYKTTEKGDKIMDFSHAGYMGGGVTIPYVPVKITVNPTGKDDTGNIQTAIDEVSMMEMTGNFRGAVLLAPGNYTISKTIEISTDGVVLRGSRSGLYGNIKSTLNLTGNPFNAITIRAPRNRNDDENLDEQSQEIQANIVDNYVPSGANTFRVSSASKLKVGDLISIDKPVTEIWIEFMQMHDLVRDGKPQTWLAAGSVLSTERQIVKISGNTVTIDVPLTDSYDSEFLSPPGVIVRTINAPNRVSHSGAEDLHIVSPPQPISHTQRHFTALRLNGEDCWVRDIFIEETMNSVAVGGKRITVQNVTVQRKALHQGSSRPAEFAPNGGQILVDRCNVIADNVWFVATGGKQSGPIVILNCNFTGNSRVESHQRWSTGMLYDNVRVETGGIDFRNRGSMGSGHGWSMGWGVAWNCVAKNFVIQNPPGVHNWMIGCIGENLAMPRPFDQEPKLPGGTIDSHGFPVNPVSLYLAQLKERLGEQALQNIGYLK